jgi:gas vesicle protein
MREEREEREEKDRIEMAVHDAREGNHSLAIGLLAGTAVGVGLGLLFAPRPGSELRRQVKVQADHLANNASTGYQRARETAGDWAHRSRDAYASSREYVSHGAHEAQLYARDVASALGEVAHALTMQSRRQMDDAGRMGSTSYPSVDQPAGGRDRIGQPREPHKDLKAV